MANSKQKAEGSAPVPGTRRKPVPIVMASGPQEYTPGDQETPVIFKGDKPKLTKGSTVSLAGK